MFFGGGGARFRAEGAGIFWLTGWFGDGGVVGGFWVHTIVRKSMANKYRHLRLDSMGAPHCEMHQWFSPFVFDRARFGSTARRCGRF